jgi:hypothetical protein
MEVHMKKRAMLPVKAPTKVPLTERIPEFVVVYEDLGDYGIHLSKAHVWRLMRKGQFPKSLPHAGRMSFTHGALVKHLRELQAASEK